LSTTLFQFIDDDLGDVERRIRVHDGTHTRIDDEVIVIPLRDDSDGLINVLQNRLGELGTPLLDLSLNFIDFLIVLVFL